MIKKYVIFILLTLCLLYPSITFNGATNGLNLWFYTIIPTLFPFMIISCLMQNVYANRWTHPIPIILLLGLLCGYPMGALAVSSAYKNNTISQKCAYLLLMSCNLSSPAFLCNYLLIHSLKLKTIAIPILLICYLPSFLVILFVESEYRQHKVSNYNCTSTSKQPTYNLLKPSHHSKTESFVNTLDTSLEQSIENILKLGGYIIIFSIIAEFMQHLPIRNELFKCVLIGTMEITTGVNYAIHTTLPLKLLLPTLLFLNTFGGLSCLMQTSIFLKDTDLEIKKYMYSKMMLTGLSILIYFLLVHVLKISLI